MKDQTMRSRRYAISGVGLDRKSANIAGVTPAVAVARERDRLDALARLRPCDASSVALMDRLARLAADLLEAPLALICLVEVDRQVLLGAYGLPEELSLSQQTPLAWSICQHAVASGRPLIVNDTHQHPDLVDHPTVNNLGVAAYAGIPLTVPGGHAIGTVSVMDTIRRDWIDDQLSFLACIARIITEELTTPTIPPQPEPTTQPGNTH